MYQYKAKLLRVLDGDTVELMIDAGFNIHLREIVRMYGINAPEMRGDTRTAGEAAKQRLEDLLNEKPIVIKTYKDRREKYGRILGDLFVQEGHVNQRMVDEGHAVEAKYE